MDRDGVIGVAGHDAHRGAHNPASEAQFHQVAILQLFALRQFRTY
jgi:hypothetical protein